MEFHSEWLLEDPIEILSELSAGLLSSDEIEKYSTSEDLTEIDKALIFLESGQMIQKLWVVRALDSYISDPRLLEVIGELIVFCN